jgi:uncharacterized protein YukE
MDALVREHAERLSALETKGDSMETSMDKLHADVKELNETLSDMRHELARYRGFWGGALLVASAVWAFVTLAWDWFVGHVKGEGG